jgi:hypothetical protein
VFYPKEENASRALHRPGHFARAAPVRHEGAIDADGRLVPSVPNARASRATSQTRKKSDSSDRARHAVSPHDYPPRQPRVNPRLAGAGAGRRRLFRARPRRRRHGDAFGEGVLGVRHAVDRERARGRDGRAQGRARETRGGTRSSAPPPANTCAAERRSARLKASVSNVVCGKRSGWRRILGFERTRRVARSSCASTNKAGSSLTSGGPAPPPRRRARIRSEARQRRRSGSGRRARRAGSGRAPRSRGSRPRTPCAKSQKRRREKRTQRTQRANRKRIAERGAPSRRPRCASTRR